LVGHGHLAEAGDGLGTPPGRSTLAWLTPLDRASASKRPEPTFPRGEDNTPCIAVQDHSIIVSGRYLTSRCGGKERPEDRHQFSAGLLDPGGASGTRDGDTARIPPLAMQAAAIGSDPGLEIHSVTVSDPPSPRGRPVRTRSGLSAMIHSQPVFIDGI